MPGMGSGRGLALRNPLVVGLFHHALLTQLLIVLAVAACTPFVWSLARLVRERRSGRPCPERTHAPEPAGRRFLRIGFGLLWTLDGLLQLQSAMPLGLPDQVVLPSAAGSPPWLLDVVRFGTTVWNDHPVSAAAAAAWIQLAIGLWLLAAPHGRLSRLAGLASVGWGAVVWVFGEALGGILAPGLSWAFGAPGGVLFYVLAGAVMALPSRLWSEASVGRSLLRAMGAFYLVMAGLQAWPGRGSWRGVGSTLARMVASMATTPQPAALAHLLDGFAHFAAGHGILLNAIQVVGLALVGLALVQRNPQFTRLGIALASILSLAAWVLVQDLGVLGGLGTDPNSAIPQILVLVGAYLAWQRPAPASTAESAVDRPAGPVLESQGRRVSPGFFVPALLTGAIVAMVGLGTVPMAVAATSPHPSATLAAAVDGPATPLDGPAPGFSLVDQNGRQVSLADLRGKVVVLTFLDPVCTSTCPLTAQIMKDASLQLGRAARDVELVAIASNPIYRSVSAVAAFTSEEQLGSLHNWLFLTGSLRALRSVWGRYGITVLVSPGGAMVDHSLLVYVIGPSGKLRWALSPNPVDPLAGPSESSSAAAENQSFATLLSTSVRELLPPR